MTRSALPLPRRWLGPLLALAVPLMGCPRHTAGPAVDAAAPTTGSLHPAAWAALESATSDLDPAVRARALALLVRHSPDPGGGDWAPRGLFDPSSWVQHAVIDALAQRAADPAAAAHLAELAAREGLDPYVRCDAALELARRSGPDPALLAVTRQAEAAAGAPWRAAPCALAAGALGDTDADARLAEILREGELPFDIAFVADVGRSGSDALIPALAEAADLVEEPLRPAIGAALLHLGSPRGEAVLREGLSAPHPQPQLEALDYLADLDHPDSTDALRRAASTVKGEARVYAQLILLGRGDGGFTLAEEAAISDDREVRGWAMRFAGEAVTHARRTEPDRRLEKVATRLLQQGAADLDDPVREAAAVAMAALPAAQVAPTLEGLLTDDNARVRIEAAGALLSAGAP